LTWLASSAGAPVAHAEFGVEPAGQRHPSANQADSCNSHSQLVSHWHRQFSQRQSAPQQQPAAPEGAVRGCSEAEKREAPAQHEQVEAVLVIGLIPFNSGRVSPF
jgi:hypothetical protein